MIEAIRSCCVLEEGEKMKVKELTKELKKHKYYINIKKTIIIMLILSIGLIGLLGPYQKYSYQKYKAFEWKETILCPDEITIMDRQDAPLIEGTIRFEGQVNISDTQVIFEIIRMIEESKNVRCIPKDEANNSCKGSYYIGTVRYNSATNINYLGTVTIFKNGTFIASKVDGLQNNMYIKGKLPKRGFEYIEKVFEEYSVTE